MRRSRYARRGLFVAQTLSDEYICVAQNMRDEVDSSRKDLAPFPHLVQILYALYFLHMRFVFIIF